MMGNRFFLQLSARAALAVLISVGFAAAALANSDGFVGSSGQSSGFYCRNCHTGGTIPTVAFDGPTTMAPDSMATFSFTVTSNDASQIAAGFNVAASDGTIGLVPEQGTRLELNEVTHSSPKPNDSNDQAVFEFTWQAPTNVGTYTLFGAGTSVNLDSIRTGDNAERATHEIVVAGEAATPTPTSEGPLPTPTATATATAVQTPVEKMCVGDCNEDGEITVDELVTGVNIALGALPVTDCLAFDANGDEEVTVDEIVQAENNALYGCAWTVNPGESIQAAVDAAAPGDTIIVMPGDYIEPHSEIAAVRITKPLKLIARSELPDRKVRILPNAGQRNGILVEPENPGDPDVDGVEIVGFTVEGFSNNGIWLAYVNNFKIEGNESINNLENGIWPTLSANGLVKKNVAYGSQDSALWVEASENVRVIENDFHHSPTGLEITVSKNVTAERNHVHNNTVGIGLYHPAAAGLPPLQPPEDNGYWYIVDNYVHDNNEPNSAPEGSLVAELPRGGGILVLGVDNVDVVGNRVEDNDFFGVAMLDWCLAVDGTEFGCRVNPPDFRDTKPEYNRFLSNVMTNNGNNPPPGPFASSAGDFLGLGGSRNCASGNTADKVLFLPSLPECE